MPAAQAAVARPVPPPQPASTPVTAARVATAVNQKSGAPAYDGKWVWPTRGRVLSPFQPSATGKQGIEIGGHADQPVNAAANGLVVYAGSGLVGYGRLIIVKHNESLLSAYGHNDTLLVNEGEHVSAGQMIAKMGSSGTNRNQLYFEIRKNGKPIDPMGYLPKQ
jgi:lipoprotein NlpD